MRTVVALAFLVTLLALACRQPAPTPTTTTEAATATPTPTLTPSPPATPTPTPEGLATPSPTPSPTATPTPTPRRFLTPTPTSTPEPSPTATATPQRSRLPTLPDAPDRDLSDLARRLLHKSEVDIPRVVNEEVPNYLVGTRHTFWVTDIGARQADQTDAILQHVTENAYWYVEEGIDVPLEELKRSAAIFEERIYPTVARYFGTPWTPGVDNDPRLTILHARLHGVAGYYSASDEYPRQVHPQSNQREIIYINTGAYAVGSEAYLGLLAHELQHAAHWNADPSEETWVNEGLSELAADLAGFPSSLLGAFIRSPTTSLIHWPEVVQALPPHYGAANLFFAYLASHYGGPERLRRLTQLPQDGVPGIIAFLRSQGFDLTFQEVFADWIIANLLDLPSGPYSYPDRDVQVQPTRRLHLHDPVERSVPQYAADYLEVEPTPGDVTLTFIGQTQTPLLPVEPPGDGTCWWGNRGDSIDATLTGRFHLPEGERITLKLTLWFDIEEFWDYAYVEVSTDGGRTWDILEGRHTSAANPVGNSFGPGYTGRSDGWVQDSLDLTPYAGRDIFLRFEYVTDDGLVGDGVCIADIAIPELEWRDSGTPPAGFAWDARGFVRTGNRVEQEYIVQVVEFTQEGPQVLRLSLDTSNRGRMTIKGIGTRVDRVVVAVAALAEKTAQHARYTLEVRPASS